MTTATATHAKHGYSSLQIAIHWTIVVLVVANWWLGDAMSRVFSALSRGEAVDAQGAAYVHVIIGLSILLIMVARLVARRQRPVAVAPDSDHPLLRTLGWLTHVTFYVLLFAIPIGGAVAWFGGSQAAGAVHGLAAQVLMVLVLVHASAALFHQFVLRDGLIRRMMRPTGGT